MEFVCFNPMPWPDVPERPKVWPFPNRSFDPQRATDFFRRQIAQLVLAEECGFDWIALGEDHMTAYGLTPNPSLILSIISQYTTRIKLAILGVPLPLLNPLRVAEECAMLDVLSGGRLIVGFIRGVPQNYAAYNVEVNESKERFAEASQLIIKAWTEPEIFCWESKHYRFPTVSLWPLPVQKPHPPLIYSANSAASAIVGAKQRAIVGAIHLYNRNAHEIIGESFAAYRSQARDDGWEPTSDRFLVGFPTCIAETDAEARRLLEPALDYQFHVLSGTYNQEKRKIAAAKPGYGITPVEENPPTLAERLAHHIVLCGSPTTVITQLEALRAELGMGVVSMHFQVGNMEDAAVRNGMTLFRDYVAPHFRQGLTSATGD